MPAKKETGWTKYICMSVKCCDKKLFQKQWISDSYQVLCPQCGERNKFEPYQLKPEDQMEEELGFALTSVHPTALQDIELRSVDRLKTYYPEFDKVFGGGLVRSGVVILGGEPGAGKSTLALQIADTLARQKGRTIIYVSLEENLIKSRLSF